MILSKDQINRYLRHIIIPEVSGPGQKKLLNSKVFICASTVEEAASLIYYLAASGIGFISCQLKNTIGFDNLLSEIQALNGDIVLELTDYKSRMEASNYDRSQDSLIRILISSYEKLKDNFLEFASEKACYEFIPTIVSVNSQWKGYLQTINNKDDFEYIFSNSIALEFTSNETSEKKKESKESILLSSCFLGTLTAIECIKLCLNIGTVLNKPLYFDLLSIEFSKPEPIDHKTSIFNFLRDYFYQNSLPLDIAVTSNTKKLSESKVLIVGTGGLGSPVAYALAGIGIGTIGLVDYDTVEISNLNRQILHSTSRIGMPKVESAKVFIQNLNSKVNIITYNTLLNATNARDIINEYDVVVDAVDNFPSRYLLNDSCFFANKPLVDAAAVRFHGLIMTILPKKGPCYRCAFPAVTNKNGAMSCSEAGVLGPVPGVMGFLQAAEVVKLLLDKGDTLYNRIIYYDALDCDFDTINTEKSANCPLCGANPTITTLTEYNNSCENKKQ